MHPHNDGLCIRMMRDEIIQRHLLTMRQTRVCQLLGQVRRYLAGDDLFLQGSCNEFAVSGCLINLHQHPWRHIGRKMVSRAAIGQGQSCRYMPVAYGWWGGLYSPPFSRYFRIMYAAPQMAAFRHVTTLALFPWPGVWRCLPLGISVFEEFAVQRIAILIKLMAGRAKSPVRKCRCGDEAIVRLFVTMFGCRRRRPVADILPHMAGRTGQPLFVQGICTFLPAQLFYEAGFLLGPRRVTTCA